WGHSEGGMITAAALEYFPDTYDGGAPMCGTVGGARRLFNGEYDLRVLYDYTCRDVPDAAFICGVCADGATRCLEDADCSGAQACAGRESPTAPEDGLTPQCLEFILAHPERFASVVGDDPFTARVTMPCLGGDTPTPEQAARRDFLV